MAKKTDSEEARYIITPKGIATLAMLQCGLIQSSDDPRLDGFWSIFSGDMERHGYLYDEDGAK